MNHNNIDIFYNYNGNKLYIKDYSDTDKSNNLNSRKLINGYLFGLLSNLDITTPIL